MKTRKKIKTITVGLGRLGRVHAINLANRLPDFEQVAVCSDRQHELDWFLNDVDGNVRPYLNFDDMLNKEKDAEAIVISSSASAHEEHLRKALQAGLHVFMEKPFGADLDTARRMYDDVKKYRNGKTLFVGYNRRCDPSYWHMKELLDQGRIGKPFFFRCFDMDPYTMALGILPGVANTQVISAAEYAKTSGGIFFDFASHSFDLIRYFFNSEAETISAKGAVNMIEGYKEAGDYDTTAVVMKLENGALGVCGYGRTCIHGYQVEMELVGTEGILRLGAIPERNMITIYDKNGAVRECSDYFIERFEKSFEVELEMFADAVRKGENGFINEEDGLRAATMAWAAKMSAKADKEIRVADL